jgi:hypothetical protein
VVVNFYQKYYRDYTEYSYMVGFSALEERKPPYNKNGKENYKELPRWVFPHKH